MTVIDWGKVRLADFLKNHRVDYALIEHLAVNQPAFVGMLAVLVEEQ